MGIARGARVVWREEVPAAPGARPSRWAQPVTVERRGLVLDRADEPGAWWVMPSREDDAPGDEPRAAVKVHRTAVVQAA